MSAEEEFQKGADAGKELGSELGELASGCAGRIFGFFYGLWVGCPILVIAILGFILLLVILSAISW